MLKRWWILAVLLVFIPFSGCKKSEGTKVTNFFGAPPQVSEVSITKERKDFQCSSSIDLCCVDPPFCSCCCVADTVTEAKAAIDMITATARVVDPTPPDETNSSDILVVVLRFLDPPPESVPVGAQINQISMEMFDNGAVSVGQMNLATQPPSVVDIYSGDLTAQDGIYTRKFYFGTSTTSGAGSCIEETDKNNLNHTFSTYGTSATLSPSDMLEFQFTVQAIDRAGNIDTSSESPLPIQGTFRESLSGLQRPCGPPSGNGGCLPGS